MPIQNHAELTVPLHSRACRRYLAAYLIIGMNTCFLGGRPITPCYTDGMLTELPDDMYALMTSPDRWTLHGDIVTICSPMQGQFPAVFEGPLSSFSKYHPQFPKYLKALLTWRQARGDRAHAYGDEVEPTLDYARSGGIEFTLDTKLVFSKANALLEIVHSDNLWFSGELLGLTESAVDNERVPVIVSSNTRNYMVPKKVFDETYPGWETRWKTAQTLGLDNNTQLEYVFTRNTKPTAQMEGVDFD